MNIKIIIILFTLCICVCCEAANNNMCIVCDSPVAEDEAHVIYRGVSYPVCSGHCLKAWEHAVQEEQLDPIVFNVEPRGAFFQGDSKFLNQEFQKAHPLSSNWLWMGIWLVAAIVSGGWAAAWAIGSHRSGLHAFIAGFLLPGVGISVFKILPKKSDIFELRGSKIAMTHDESYCSHCNHPCHPSAQICSECGASFTPKFESEASKVRK